MSPESLSDAFEQELCRRRLIDRNLSLLAYDGFGTLYFASPSGSIVGADVRQQLLVGSWAKHSDPAGRQEEAASRVFRLQPEPLLDLNVAHFAVSNDGSYAAVAGPSSQDEEYVAAAVLDLRGARAVPGASGREIPCECSSVDAGLFSTRPGLQILQIAWHPGSVKHFAILSSDNTWRLYCVEELTLAEQCFQLQVRDSRAFGLSNNGQLKQVVAFAFGQGQLWQTFTVYFLTTDGDVFLLCPVAPFSSSFQTSLAGQLVAPISNDSDSNSQTTLTWVQQALGLPLQEPQDEDVERRAGLAGPLASVQPHALREHTPVLQGPLEVACPDTELLSLTDMCQQGDIAVSLASTWCGPACSVLIVATADGLIGWHLVAHSPAPEWAACSPNCIVEGDSILAVRNQVAVSEDCNQELLLLTAARVDPLTDDPVADLWTGPPPIRLLSDPIRPECLFCVHAHGAHVVTTPWLPLLASQLAQEDRGVTAIPDLRLTSIEELWASAASGPHCVGAAPVGDALTGTALALLLSDGHAHCLWPAASSHGQLAKPLDSENSGSGAAQVEAQVRAIYGNLLRGPRNLSMPKLEPVGAGQPEGQRLLTDSITTLREKHVEFQHSAHHDLLKRLEETESAARTQQARASHLSKAAMACDQQIRLLTTRLQRASQWNDNLHARVKLLTELHWALPHPLSDAEAHFKLQELPNLENDIRQLSSMLKGLRKRADAIDKDGVVCPGQHAPEAAVPAGQVRSLRSALADQADLIRAAQALASSLEHQLEAVADV